MTEALLTDLSAFILAGGKSTRMGTNKALIKIDNQDMILHSLNLAAKFTKAVFISGEKAEYHGFNIPMVKDKINDIGPLGGIFSCLQQSTSTYNLFLPCDVPYLSESVIQKLINSIFTNNYQAVIAKSHKGNEPLISVMNKNILPTIQTQIELTDYKMQNLLAKINYSFIDFSELSNSNTLLFNNINTPTDRPKKDLLP